MGPARTCLISTPRRTSFNSGAIGGHASIRCVHICAGGKQSSHSIRPVVTRRTSGVSSKSDRSVEVLCRSRSLGPTCGGKGMLCFAHLRANS